MTMIMDTIETLLTTAVNAAIGAGGEIMNVYDDPAQDFGIELKADNSPLTKADRRADAAIAAALRPTGISILSEESAHAPYGERRHWERMWIVDPLDGTKEFIKKNGDFTVNIALAEGGTPVAGAIYVPATRELYWGLRGRGAGKASKVGSDRRFAASSVKMGKMARKTAYLSVDGGKAFKLIGGDAVELRVSHDKTNLVHLTGRTFYEILSQKLGRHNP